MAETLGVASGIARLINLTIEVFGIRYIDGVRNALCSARRFLKKLKALQIVLHRVEQVANEKYKLEAFNDTGLYLLSINEANKYINLLQNSRGKLQQRQSHSAFRNHVKALTWPFSEKETFVLTESFHRHLERSIILLWQLIVCTFTDAFLERQFWVMFLALLEGLL